MIIGFTGTRNGMTDFQKEHLATILREKFCTEFMHGDCLGADQQANDIAKDCGIKIFTIHPPDDSRKRAFCFDQAQLMKYNKDVTPYYHITGVDVRWFPTDAYLKRNHRIVDMCELIVATPKEFTHTIRSGTWATIRYAWKTKKDSVIVIPPVDRMEEQGDSEAEFT